ncbi:hypothetical protein HJC23_007397 [Cyclotella cryptica]|uniref:RNA-dependent RNA polymerase n=1 Tax=Cyclotella cryptica TaxID=29204 RepID=A0ABD3QIA8_9STRA|eukprot:CCRYP_005114-RA/>CCRYP_005114-RA protein AED:0.36 eAED:0.36 QI:0/-1/0/1/-1/1/1/0/971
MPLRTLFQNSNVQTIGQLFKLKRNDDATAKTQTQRRDGRRRRHRHRSPENASAPRIIVRDEEPRPSTEPEVDTEERQTVDEHVPSSDLTSHNATNLAVHYGDAMDVELQSLLREERWVDDEIVKDAFVAVEETSSPFPRNPNETRQDPVIQRPLVRDHPNVANTEERSLEPPTIDDVASFVTANDDMENSSLTSLSYNQHQQQLDASEENTVFDSFSNFTKAELTVEHFHVGDEVRVCGTHPTHRNKRGTVMGETKCFVKVLLEGSTLVKPTNISPKFLMVEVRSVSVATNNRPSSASTTTTPTTTVYAAAENVVEKEKVNHSIKPRSTEGSETSNVFHEGDEIQVLSVHPNHGDKCGVVIRTTDCFVIFAESFTKKEIRIKPKFLSHASATRDSSRHSDDDGGAPNSAECSVVAPKPTSQKRLMNKASNGTSNKSHVQTKPKAILSTEPAQFVLERLCYIIPNLAADSAFKQIWRGKYRIRDLELPLGKNSFYIPPLDLKIEEGGKHYELYHADVKHDPSRGMAFRGMHVKAKKIVSYYVQTDNLREHEESLADFGSLNPRKVWARRQLFLSEAVKLTKKMGLQHVSKADIAMVKDDGTVGCGFIGEQYLESLLGGGAEAKRTIGIQVRIFVPSVGVFKGVLVRKPQSTGPPIELNESLQKVLPSTQEDAADNGYIVIKRTFPSKANLQIGRLFRRDRAVTQSFKRSLQSNEDCKLSDMYIRLLNGLGVSKDITEEYSKLYRNIKHLRHTHLVGVADPTGKLPPNTVFMTGVKRGDLDVDKVFVTRPPCLEPEDGRVLELIATRPRGMSQNEWDWLNTLYFGALVFANQMEGQRPLPELIADGDLDGDLYFVCWDKKIVSNIRDVPIQDDNLCASDVKGTVSYDPDWFDKTQTFISDVNNILCVHNFIGFLFNQSKEIADAKSIRDADAIAFAKAYKQALEFKKHGEKICIPAHLLTRVPEHFHNICQSV